MSQSNHLGPVHTLVVTVTLVLAACTPIRAVPTGLLQVDNRESPAIATPQPEPTRSLTMRITLPGFDKMAEHFGISEEKLLIAMGGLPPNVEQAARILGVSEEEIRAQLPPGFRPREGRPEGLVLATAAASPGYTLVAPMDKTVTYLINNQGETVHSWQSDYTPGNAAYLLEDGSLMRTALPQDNPMGLGAGNGGMIEKFDWDGNLTWSYNLYGDDYTQHHDITIMPNGHILALVYEKLPAEQAIALGREPRLIPEEWQQVWGDSVVEIDPATNEIVWRWRVFDHLVQHVDPALPNYGDPAQTPGRINFNFIGSALSIDWIHLNTVYYNQELDQILLMSREFSELWIIDHSLTQEEAAGPAGDLLYRWGNPETQNLEGERHILFAHDARWVSEDKPNITIFNNGVNEIRKSTDILEIIPELDSQGHYVMRPGQPQQAEIVWQYAGEPPESFYAQYQGGAQTLPNGNLLLTDSTNGRLFEITRAGATIWDWYDEGGSWLFRATRYPLDYPVFGANGLK
ncbi:MAG: aryl-sulfate sulfotransferase [Caldilineaceae bacterium]